MMGNRDRHWAVVTQSDGMACKAAPCFDLVPASPPFHSQSTCHGLGPKDLLEGQREILLSVERRFSLSSQDYQCLCLSQRRPQAEYPALTDSWHLPGVPTTASHIPLSHRGAGWWREAWPQHSLYVFSCSKFHSYKVEIYIYSLHLIKKWDFPNNFWAISC